MLGRHASISIMVYASALRDSLHHLQMFLIMLVFIISCWDINSFCREAEVKRFLLQAMQTLRAANHQGYYILYKTADRWWCDCQPCVLASRTLFPWRFLVLIYVTGWVDPRFIVWLVGLGQLKKSKLLTRTQTLTFWLKVLCLNQLCYQVPQLVL
jgi:hypothetical protein